MLLQVLDIALVNASGLVGSPGNLVEIICGILEQKHHLAHIGKVKPNNIAVHRHLTKIGFSIADICDCHFLRDKVTLRFRHPHFQADITLWILNCITSQGCEYKLL